MPSFWISLLNTRSVLGSQVFGQALMDICDGMKQEVVQGGPFTRKDPASGKLSCLDLFIVSRELVPYVESSKIDSKQEFAVARAVWTGEIYSNVYILAVSSL